MRREQGHQGVMIVLICSEERRAAGVSSDSVAHTPVLEIGSVKRNVS